MFSHRKGTLIFKTKKQTRMIDLININITDGNRFENALESDKSIDLISNFNTLTGEILKFPKKTKFQNFNIRVNEVYSKIVGSFHKYKNLIKYNKDHNYDDFTYNEFSELLPDFIKKFDLEDNNSISKLELGFNIELDFDPQKFIDNNLIMYNNKNANKDLKLNGKGDFKEFIKNDYSIKIYNKSKQYKKKNHILRIELKLSSKRKIQHFGIFCLNDLLDKKKLSDMFIFLYNEFDKLTIIDNFNFDNLPQKDREKLIQYTNPNYWNSLKSKNKSYKVIYRLKNDFDLLLNKNNLNTVKKEMKQKLTHKFEYLISDNNTNYN